MDTKQPFEKIVDLHGPTVLRVCRAVVGPLDADDVWQETFISALRAYPDLPVDANVEAWLVTIAHRRSLDSVRAEVRRPVPVDRVPDSTSPLGNPSPPADGVWAHVARLPDKQRRVIAYRYLADLPFGEIAGIVGGTPAAARRAAADGLKKLRILVTADQPEGDRHEHP
ncbi:sigma-70 family RNA polymerase sigma factor [Sinomonas notoginsengisoli]|uniref:RNA polymerase sigma factor n=1 Tax=Sinomonas notoginsengisoli TaxID=1457311 RepID=UPI001F15E744|nr:RNA polymerase sigma factor [Sinomonas notoginsengisoli]